jgi:tellurite resistance-related uncharacterized protein
VGGTMAGSTLTRPRSRPRQVVNADEGASMDRPLLPIGLEHVRTTDTFDNHTVPPGLLRAHRVAANVWGRLVVHSGTVTFVFDDDPEHPITASAGCTVAIQPARQHHLELHEPATFSVEFHRFPDIPGSSV